MYLGTGRPVAQESLRQIKVRTIPLIGHHLTRTIWEEKVISNDYPHHAASMHEFWVVGSGYGKSRMGFAKAVHALELGYGGLILDAASVISHQFIRYVASIGFPPEKTIIVDFGQEFSLGSPVFDFLQTSQDVSYFKAVEELVHATVTLSEAHSTAGDRQIDLARRAFLALQLAGKCVGDIDLFAMDAGFRATVCKAAGDPSLERFWVGKEAYFNTLPRDALESLRNKWSGLCLHPMTKPMISSRQTSIDLFEAMQQGFWVIVNLSEDHLGLEIQQRVGQLFQCALKTATLRRQRVEERRPFLCICDEYPQYKSSTTHTNLLRISRNMNLGLVFLCQDTAPFTDAEFFTLTGNCSTVGVMNCSKHDAEAMAGEIFLHHGSTWRDWEYTRNMSAPDELRAYAALIMDQEPGRAIVRVKPAKDAYFLDVPHVDYPPAHAALERTFREAVAKRWYRKPSPKTP